MDGTEGEKWWCRNTAHVKQWSILLGGLWPAGFRAKVFQEATHRVGTMSPFVFHTICGRGRSRALSAPSPGVLS